MTCGHFGGGRLLLQRHREVARARLHLAGTAARSIANDRLVSEGPQQLDVTRGERDQGLPATH